MLKRKKMMDNIISNVEIMRGGDAVVDIISFSIFLEYLYNKFIITFIICLIGSIIRIAVGVDRFNRINAKKMVASVVVASAIMCVVADNIKISFTIYIVLCMVIGLWAEQILNLIMNTKFMIRLLKKITSSMKDPLVKSISSTIDEMEKEEEQNKDKENSDENS